MKIKGIIFFVLLQLVSCNQEKNTSNWASFFNENNVKGTFVLKNTTTNEILTYNDDRSNKEFVPASTFKILNSMIALQELSISSINDTIKWDGLDRGYEPWNKDQTMKSAFPISCVWFYQQLARRTGRKKMQRWIAKSNYGNEKLDSELDRFWLDGRLAISAKGQIDFLERFVNNELPFDKNIQEVVKNIMLTDSTKNYTIYSKTGWSNNIGWNVGYVETKDNVWIFALNIDMNNMKMANVRKIITYDILEEQKIIE